MSGELHAKLRVGSGMRGARAGGEGRGPSRGLAALSVGGGGAWPGFKPTRRAAEQRPGPTGVEGAGGAGGPGCGARGRWWGMVAVPVGGGRARAGLEIDHSEPSGSRVAISRAGRRPPAHTAARPIKARPRGGRRSVGATNNKQKDRHPPAHAAAGPAGQRARRLERQRRHTQHPYNRPGTPKGRVPKYPPLVGSLSHCLVEAQAE